MEKLNLGLFYCDIYGTFALTSSEFNTKERNKEVDNFIQELLLIIKQDKLDELKFSFTSTSSFEEVYYYINEFKERLLKCKDENVKKIKLNTCFCDTGKILHNFELKECFSKNSKALQILRNASKNIKEKLLEISQIKGVSIEEVNKNLKTKIYYADDSQINHIVLNALHKSFSFKTLAGVENPNIQCVEFLPNAHNALKDTNLLIKKKYKSVSLSN